MFFNFHLKSIIVYY